MILKAGGENFSFLTGAILRSLSNCEVGFSRRRKLPFDDVDVEFVRIAFAVQFGHAPFFVIVSEPKINFI